MRLTRRQMGLLWALAEGHALKAHRDVEGGKVYRLHRLDGSTEDVAESDVRRLIDHRLIDSNKKFPAATFFLTERSVELLRKTSSAAPLPGLVATEVDL